MGFSLDVRKFIATLLWSSGRTSSTPNGNYMIWLYFMLKFCPSEGLFDCYLFDEVWLHVDWLLGECCRIWRECVLVYVNAHTAWIASKRVGCIEKVFFVLILSYSFAWSSDILKTVTLLADFFPLKTRWLALRKKLTSSLWWSAVTLTQCMPSGLLDSIG